MERTPIKTPGLDLSTVFGSLSSAEAARLVSDLERAEAGLLALRESLPGRAGDPWRFEGVCLDTYPSGLAEITAYVENSDVCFWLELTQGILATTAWSRGSRETLVGRWL
jgi:hypothetical protein